MEKRSRSNRSKRLGDAGLGGASYGASCGARDSGLASHRKFLQNTDRRPRWKVCPQG